MLWPLYPWLWDSWNQIPGITQWFGLEEIKVIYPSAMGRTTSQKNLSIFRGSCTEISQFGAQGWIKIAEDGGSEGAKAAPASPLGLIPAFQPSLSQQRRSHKKKTSHQGTANNPHITCWNRACFVVILISAPCFHIPTGLGGGKIPSHPKERSKFRTWACCCCFHPLSSLLCPFFLYFRAWISTPAALQPARGFLRGVPALQRPCHKH